MKKPFNIIGIMISKTIGFRGLAYFQTHPFDSGVNNGKVKIIDSTNLWMGAGRDWGRPKEYGIFQPGKSGDMLEYSERR